MAQSTEHFTCDICNTVKLKRIANMWRKLAGGRDKLPQDVPPGHLAVIVGRAGKRFVIRADYLNHPIFRQLLDQEYEEHGHNKSGPLSIQCDEFFFEDIIQSLRCKTNAALFSCHVANEKMGSGSWGDSRSLLQGYTC